MIRDNNAYQQLKIAQENYTTYMKEVIKTVEEYENKVSKMRYSNEDLPEKIARASQIKTHLEQMNKKRNDNFLETALTFSAYGKTVSKKIVLHKKEYTEHKERLDAQLNIIKLQENYNRKLNVLYIAVDKQEKSYKATQNAERKL